MSAPNPSQTPSSGTNQPSPESPFTPPEQTTPSDAKKAYNVVTDTVTGVNLRWSDNKFQAVFVAGSVVVLAPLGLSSESSPAASGLGFTASCSISADDMTDQQLPASFRIPGPCSNGRARLLPSRYACPHHAITRMQSQHLALPALQSRTLPQHRTVRAQP